MSTNTGKADYNETIDAIKLKKTNFTPKVGIILGSGLGGIATQIEYFTQIPYDEIPNFPISTVEGHLGNLLLGYIKGTPVVCLQGRVHIYEGFNPFAIKIMIRTLKLLGCESLLITNSAGSFRQDFNIGSLMLINDHINFQFVNNVISGSNDGEFGPRFLSMDEAYDKKLRNQLLDIAKDKNIKLKEGVYMAVTGPCFETPAEIRAFKTLGADAIGMSTVPEVIVACHCGLKVAGISVITNLVAGMNENKLSHEQTLSSAKFAEKSLSKLISTFCEQQNENK